MVRGGTSLQPIPDRSPVLQILLSRDDLLRMVSMNSCFGVAIHVNYLLLLPIN